jgi:S1-C subfamily serine protease
VATRSKLEQLSGELAALVARVLPNVVALSGKTDSGDVSGSGFVVDDAGHVVTNWHVVDGCGASMRASTPHGPLQDAAVLGADDMTDLAVLRLTTPIETHLSLRTTPARVGELCLALGSPLGIYPESASFGMVSGVARTIPQENSRPIERAIQTDAAINPGNSGGPLVDMSGEVLGVNKCVDSRGAGLGFAIPADTVARITADLVRDGHVTRASVGVTVVNRPVPLDGQEVMRLVVTKVRAPVEGGFEVGDVILTIGGEVCDERDDLYNHLTKDAIGKPVSFDVLRAGQAASVTVTATQLGG